MSRIITALFDTRADADAGAARLREAGAEAAHVNVHDRSTHGVSGEHSTREDQGLWASIKSVFVPDEDRHAYEEGLRRGGFLLTAQVEEDTVATAVAALEYANAIDLDARSATWRQDGWRTPTHGETPDTDGADTLIPFGTRDNDRGNGDRGNGRYRSYSNPTVPQD